MIYFYVYIYKKKSDGNNSVFVYIPLLVLRTYFTYQIANILYL